MQGHGAIKIGLGRTHPHSDCSHLDNFSGLLTNHVTSQHLLAGGLQNQLQQATRALFRQSLSHGAKTRTMNHNMIRTELGDCFLFR